MFLKMLAVRGGILAVILAVALLLRWEFASVDVRGLVDGLLNEWPVTAAGVFVVGYALAVALMLPTLWLNLLAGVIWGPALGGVLALLGSISGALAAFTFVRVTVGQLLAKPANLTLLRRLQVGFAQGGWRIVALVRLNPIFPGPVSHLFGLTSIDFRTYAWATAVFVAPPTFLFSAVGHTAGEIGVYGLDTDLKFAIAGIGLPLALVEVGLLVLRSRKLLRSDT